jgi:hypothetical protein
VRPCRAAVAVSRHGRPGLQALVAQAGYPHTSVLSAWQSIGTLLLAKCARRPRIHHIGALTDDAGLAFTLGLTALPKATHLGSYSYRVRRQSNHTLLTGLVRALRPLGLASGAAGFNLDFHAIRHHGDDAVLDRHYVPRRSQRTRAVLTFFAQDHTSAEMVYANADITKAEQAREIIAFADYWQQATGTDPGLLVFDSQLTTYTVLEELTGRGIRWLTLRQRGKAELDRLAALPASAWTTARLTAIRPLPQPTPARRPGQTQRHPHTRPPDRRHQHRPRPAHPAHHQRPGHPRRDLFGRYAERMLIENELDAYIAGFHLDALSSSIPLNVDLDTTLTVVAGNLYRLLAANCRAYQTATPDKLWRHFLDTGAPCTSPTTR